MRARVGDGTVVDVGCGLGFETVELTGPGRRVVGVDHDAATAAIARDRWGDRGLLTACTDGARIGLRTGAADWVCSSHLIEHFEDPSRHAAELARMCADDGTVFVVTPNAPADFENPYHVSLLDPAGLDAVLGAHFDEVRVQGLDANERVKADFEARRRTGNKLLRLDVLNLRRRLPRRWYIALYSRALTVTYRLLKDRYAGGATGITAADFFVTDDIDETTLVLLATARRPRRPADAARS